MAAIVARQRKPPNTHDRGNRSHNDSKGSYVRYCRTKLLRSVIAKPGRDLFCLACVRVPCSGECLVRLGCQGPRACDLGSAKSARERKPGRRDVDRFASIDAQRDRAFVGCDRAARLTQRELAVSDADQRAAQLGVLGAERLLDDGKRALVVSERVGGALFGERCIAETGQCGAEGRMLCAELGFPDIERALKRGGCFGGEASLERDLAEAELRGADVGVIGAEGARPDLDRIAKLLRSLGIVTLLARPCRC